MSIYLKTEEVRASLGAVVKYYLQDCVQKNEIPQELVELIKHNFLAKYVSYNKKDETIEIGINISKDNSVMYPTIEVFTFSVNSAEKWLENSFKSGKADLEFYAKIINKNVQLSREDVVVV
ncbi:hypothetical protein [Salinimicrobium sp. GXAS 041]|uniref:hypothetical protein n=1 Tax=Salinimicrobium sp. GXAS 041 TaxID=3400806 RepID=UPI003C71DC73